MEYYIDLFTPETAEAFANAGKVVSGFRESRKAYIENKKIGPGDKFICYVVRLQRFIGVLELQSKFFLSDKPIFQKEKDPFVLRFQVTPLVWLPLEKSIPIHNDCIWKTLSFTKQLKKDDNAWTHWVFSSPRLWPKEDCNFLEKLLIEQGQKMVDYPFSEKDQKKLKVPISVPKDIESDSTTKHEKSPNGKIREPRASHAIQAKLAEIGEKLGMKIWIPRPDRSAILETWKPKNDDSLLDELYLAFDEKVLKTIRNIDILWLNRRTIVRAFEVEDTTSIYSGILRMADLLAANPNIKIKLHIVAPTERRDEVFSQISREVFNALESGPLRNLCSYISYESIQKLAKEKNLQHMSDTIVDDYSEFYEE